MKIYLETKDKDNHRIVFVSDNGKLTFQGEWCKSKWDANMTVRNLAKYFGAYQPMAAVLEIVERPYKPGSFARNAGPKKKSTTKAKK